MIFFIDPIRKSLTRKKPHELTCAEKVKFAPGTIHYYKGREMRIIVHQWIYGPKGNAEQRLVMSSTEHSNATMLLLLPESLAKANSIM